jgi:type II secretory pathway component PulJ
MNILKNLYNYKKIKKSKEAFTYIEVIVSLLIIALLAGLLYFSYAICIKGINSSRKSVKESIEWLNTDSILRKKIEAVSIPFWQKDYEYSFTPNSLTISWVNGLNASETINLPNIFKIQAVEPINSENDSIKGLIIKYQYKNSDYELKALFSSRPYGSAQI